MRDRSLGKAKKVGPDPKCQALSQCRNLVGKRQPGTTAGQDPPIGGAGLAVRPDIDISQDRVAKALAAGGPGKLASSPRFGLFQAAWSLHPGRLSFTGEPVVPPVSPLLLLAPTDAHPGGPLASEAPLVDRPDRHLEELGPKLRARKHMTPEEQRQFDAGREAFLAEIVRLILARKRETP